MAKGMLVAELSVDSQKLESGLNKAENKIQELNNVAKKINIYEPFELGAKSMNKFDRGMSDSLRKMENMFGGVSNKFHNSMLEMAKSADNFTSSFGLSISSLLETLSNPAVLIAGASASIFALGKSAVSAASEIQTLDTNLGTLLGSMSKGKELRKELQKYGEATPYDTDGLVGAATTLLQYGVAQEKVMPLMRQMGDVALGNKDHLNALALAFGQMTAAGKVTKQDLNQMANAGFGINEMAKSAGMSVGEFNDKVSAGEIPLETISKALEDATSKGGLFANAAINSSQTLDGVMSNLEESMHNILANIGENLLPIVQNAASGLVSVFDGIGDVISYFNDPTEEAKEKLGVFGTVVEAVRNYIEKYGEAIENIISPIIDFIQNTDNGNSMLGDLSNGIASVINMCGDFISILGEVTGEIINGVKQSGVFTNVLNVLKGAFNLLMTIVNIYITNIQTMWQWVNRNIGGFGGLAKAIKLLTVPINAVITVTGWLISKLQTAFNWIQKVSKFGSSVLNPNGKPQPTPHSGGGGNNKPQPTPHNGGGNKPQKKPESKKITNANGNYKSANIEIDKKKKSGYYKGNEKKYYQDKSKALDKLISAYAAEGKDVSQLIKQKQGYDNKVNSINAGIAADKKAKKEKESAAKKAQTKKQHEIEKAQKIEEQKKLEVPNAYKKYQEDLAKIDNKEKSGFYKETENGDVKKLEDQKAALKNLITVLSEHGIKVDDLVQKQEEYENKIKEINKNLSDNKKKEQDAAKEIEEHAKKVAEATEKLNNALDSDNFKKKDTGKNYEYKEEKSEGETNFDDKYDSTKDVLDQLEAQYDELISKIEDAKKLGIDTSDAEKKLKELKHTIHATSKELNTLEESEKIGKEFKEGFDEMAQGGSAFFKMAKNIKSLQSIFKDSNAQQKIYGKTLSGVEKGAIVAGEGVSMLGESLQSMAGDGEAAKVGAIMAAIGQLALSFAQTLLTAKTPLEWLAFGVTGLATLITMTSTIGSFANGGIIGGNGTPSGDMGLIRANVGEMVLNKSQQSNLFDLLDNGGGIGTPTVGTVRVKGSDLYLAMSNFSKIKGKSGIITGIR